MARKFADAGKQRALYAYTNMKTRCTNPKTKNYPRYGGRGVSVCPRWADGEGGLSGFDAFFADMGAPGKNMTLERTGNDRNYSRDNCVWACRTTQAKNRRTTLFMDTKWGRMCVKDAAKRAGVPYTTVLHRLERGWSAEDALTKRKHVRLGPQRGS